MPAVWRYRGREISAEEIVFIRRFITEHPRASRRALSTKLCEAWEWKQANGAPRDMVCRGLLLMLHRAGQIELPRVRFTPPNPLVRRLGGFRIAKFSLSIRSMIYPSWPETIIFGHTGATLENGRKTRL